MKKKITIMMLGGGRRVSVAESLIAAGARLGFEVRVIGYELEEQVPLALVGKIVKGMKWSEEGVIHDVVRVATQEEADIILPFVGGGVIVAARCKAMLPHVFIPVTAADTALTMFDKQLAAKAFKEAGLPIPKTYSVINAEVPAIAKPRYGYLSRGVKIFYSLDNLMHLENLSDYLIQEYIENCREYTVDCYINQQGEILVMVPRKRLEVMGGESTRTVTVREPRLQELGRRVIEAFSLRGPVTLQFLYDPKKGRFLLMEVNPRLGGGVNCSVYAGAPIMDYIIKESMGEALAPCDDWREGTLAARYMKEAIFNA